MRRTEEISKKRKTQGKNEQEKKRERKREREREREKEKDKTREEGRQNERSLTEKEAQCPLEHKDSQRSKARVSVWTLLGPSICSPADGKQSYTENNESIASCYH